MQCCHRTALGVTGSAVALGLSLDTIFLHGVKEADKGGTGSHGWACGDQGHVEWLLANKEMEIS